MPPELARLGHVALETPDLEDSLWFFRTVVGLEEVARRDGTVYLRSADEFQHHSLSLTAASSPGVDHIGWQTRTPSDVERFAESLRRRDIEVTTVGADTELGQGEAIRFRTPNGHPFECYYEMDKPDPPRERRSKLKNRVYDPTGTNPVSPNRIDHVQMWHPRATASAEWLQEALDFDLLESYDFEDGRRWGTFLSASGVKIEAVVILDEDGDYPPSLHHTAYKVNDATDLFDAGNAMREHGVPVDGMGQHGISRGKFLYARDPASGHRVEFSAGGYLTFDPDWEPVTWEAGDISEGDDHQWLGGIDSTDRVPY